MGESLEFVGEMTYAWFSLTFALKFMGEMASTEMDITMKNLCLDLFQRLNVGEFTRYVTFEKG